MSTILIVPGLHSSGASHWQTWFQQQIPEARRVEQADWGNPVLAAWTGWIRREIDRASGPVWLVAHSFGCLAAVSAAVDRPERVAGMMLVAPADPDRFGLDGLRTPNDECLPITQFLPTQQLPFPSILIASTDDPWLTPFRATWLAERWGSRYWSLGAAGHINAESGFGPWPEGLRMFRALQAAQGSLPLGGLSTSDRPQLLRNSSLARIRHRTRVHFHY